MAATATLPPLTGSTLFDPWRLRYREMLVTGGQPMPERRPTRSETLLWEALQAAPRAWAAEFPTKHGYTLDFSCAEVRLAIEVDGPSHWGRFKAERDAWRDLVHKRMGIRTHRFSADHVERDVVGVTREVEALAGRRAAELAGSVPVHPVPAPDLDELDVEERLLQFPPEAPGWSTYLPACRTVLPTAVARRPLRELLGRL